MLTMVKLVPKYQLTVESVVIGFQRSMNRSCVLICGIHLFYFRVIDNTGISNGTTLLHWSTSDW